MGVTRGINFRATVGMTPKEKAQRIKRIGAAIHRFWVKKTDKLGPRYKQPYRAAMHVEVSDRTATLSLDPSPETSTLVRSVEYGFGPGGVGTSGPYDMRTTLLKSSSARTDRHGNKYLNVPMGITTRRIASLGGSAAYKAAKRLMASVRTAAGTKWGGRLANPSGFADRIQKQSRHVPGIGHVPAHKTDPLANLYRFKRPKRRGSTYGTFRRISEHGKPWVHPGIKAHRFMRKVARAIRRIVREVG